MYLHGKGYYTVEKQYKNKLTFPGCPSGLSHATFHILSHSKQPKNEDKK